MGRSVRQGERPAEDVAELVVHPRPRRGQRDPREVGAVEHLLVCAQIGGVGAQAAQPRDQRAHPFPGHGPVDGVGARGPQAVHGMSQGVPSVLERHRTGDPKNPPVRSMAVGTASSGMS